jgi:alpha,alpha-trehalose phosphorylase
VGRPGRLHPGPGRAFCINEVTGPDEYTALVNNNGYTNLMARAHLRYAARLADELPVEAPEWYAGLAGRIGLDPEEVAEWRRAADLMRIPRDAGLGIHAQDDSFLDRAPWPFATTPASDYPLLLHYHPLVIYRHQVLKQSDVVLAQVLLASEFTTAEKKRNFDYYDPLTTGDSSLSPCIQSVAAAGSVRRRGVPLLMQTARMDLDDVNRNVATASTSRHGGLVGVAGVRLRRAARRRRHARVLAAPARAWPPGVPAPGRRRTLRVTLTRHEVEYALLAGDDLAIRHFGRPLRVTAGAPLTCGVDPRLEAVIFDLDGVITDTAEHHYRAWQRLAAETSLPFDRELNERLKGVSRMESLDIILEHAGRMASLPDKVRLADRKNAYFRELIDAITPADLLPGIGDLLADLRARGVRTAIASMSHNVWDVVRRLGIEPLVDVIVDPATLVKGKPDPEIFLAAAEALGVRFEDCLGIEDARAGVQAIKAARMVAVGVGRDLPGCDWQVPDTSHLTTDALAALFPAGGPAPAPVGDSVATAGRRGAAPR